MFSFYSHSQNVEFLVVKAMCTMIRAFANIDMSSNISSATHKLRAWNVLLNLNFLFCKMRVKPPGRLVITKFNVA